MIKLDKIKQRRNTLFLSLPALILHTFVSLERNAGRCRLRKNSNLFRTGLEVILFLDIDLIHWAIALSFLVYDDFFVQERVVNFNLSCLPPG